MTADRVLIVNADDFGQSSGINRGIVEAFEQGIVTSASLMVRHAGAAEAAMLARRRRLDVGLHVDLGEWMCQNGDWTALYEVVPIDDPVRIAAEIEHQLQRFRTLLDHDPSHLDSHQHVHLRSPVREVMAGLAEQLGVPLRGVTPRVNYCGRFYGQTAEGLAMPGEITIDALLRILDTLSGGVTELGCHPGYDDGLVTMYREERVQELATVCAPQVRDAIARLGIELRSFDGLRAGITDAGSGRPQGRI